MQVSSVTKPVIRFGNEPKSSVYPPPKDRVAVFSRERAMTVTTTADTIGAMNFFQYLAVMPSRPSKRPPAMTHPTTVPYPCSKATVLSGTINVKLRPMKMGRPDPKRQMGVACRKVAIPAAIIAF